MDASKHRIPYTVLRGTPHKSPEAMAREILDMEGLAVKDISFRSLVLEDAALDASIIHWSGRKAFGRGVYVFRKQDGEGKHWPVYVGKAPEEFLRRVFQHLDPMPKAGYGFNAMLQYIARDTKRIRDDEKGLREAREWLLDGGSLVLIDMEGEKDVPKQAGRLESDLIRAMYRITKEYTWMQQWPKRRKNHLKKNVHHRGKGGGNG